MTKHAVLLGLVALAVACSPAPEYVRPSLSVPTQWPGSPVGAGDTPLNPGSESTADSWRVAFPDAELQHLIALALEHNRDMAIAVFRVEEARAQAGIASAALLPSVDLNALHEARGTSSNVVRSSFSTTSQRYEIGLGVASFEADFWGRLRTLDDAARANFFSTEYARSAFRLTLIRDVAQGWFSVLELRQRHALTRKTASSREVSLNLVAHRRDAGLAGDIDFHQATGALATAQAEFASVARQLVAAENAMRVLVGKDLAGGPVSVMSGGSQTGATELVRQLAAGLPAAVLLKRPDILAAEQKLIAANANIGAARASFFPRIALTATAGTASSALSGLFAAGSGAWSFVPAFTVPLFDGGRNQDNLDIAQARKNIAVAEYEKTIQLAFRDIANLLAARTHYLTQMAALQVNVDAQSERLRLVDARYAGGLANHLELLDAQRDSYAAQQNWLAVRQQSLSTEASLFAALGGN